MVLSTVTQQARNACSSDDGTQESLRSDGGQHVKLGGPGAPAS